MQTVRFAVVGGLLVLFAGIAVGQPPPAFQLLQSAPNPFCSEAGSEGFTTIQFATPQAAHILLEVRSSDGGSLVKALVNGQLQAGYYSVSWDGRNDVGEYVGNGSYPYVLTAIELGGGITLYEATLTAEITCVVRTELTTWGRLKSLLLRRLR